MHEVGPILAYCLPSLVIMRGHTITCFGGPHEPHTKPLMHAFISIGNDSSLATLCSVSSLIDRSTKILTPFVNRTSELVELALINAHLIHSMRAADEMENWRSHYFFCCPNVRCRQNKDGAGIYQANKKTSF